MEIMQLLSDPAAWLALLTLIALGEEEMGPRLESQFHRLEANLDDVAAELSDGRAMTAIATDPDGALSPDPQ